jgi:hypothetical protein
MTKQFPKLLLSFFSLIAASVIAQPTAATISTTTSTCAANGTLTVTSVTGGTAPYRYQIIAGPIFPAAIPYVYGPVNGGGGLVRSLQNSNVFNALPKGNYTVRIVDATNATYIVNGPGVTATSATVPGTYEDPSLDSVQFNPATSTCGGTYGNIVVIGVSQGVGPYQYRLLNMPSQTLVQNWGASNVFTNLPTGDYRVQVRDACNNFKSQDGTVGTAPGAGPLGWKNQVYPQQTSLMYEKSDCDNHYNVIATGSNLYYLQMNGLDLSAFDIGVGGVGPYTYNLYKNNVLVESKLDKPVFLNKAANYLDTFKLSITDACGTVTPFLVHVVSKLNNVSDLNKILNCEEDVFNLSIQDNNYRFINANRYNIDYWFLGWSYYHGANNKLPYTFEVISGPVIPQPVTIQSFSHTFPNLPPGTYITRITDACGVEAYDTVTTGGERILETVQRFISAPSACYGTALNQWAVKPIGHPFYTAVTREYEILAFQNGQQIPQFTNYTNFIDPCNLVSTGNNKTGVLFNSNIYIYNLY